MTREELINTIHSAVETELSIKEEVSPRRFTNTPEESQELARRRAAKLAQKREKQL
jgi:hypothetical protein